jgi:hypothetical protein
MCGFWARFFSALTKPETSLGMGAIRASPVSDYIIPL